MSNTTGFEAFVVAHQDVVYATAWRLLGNATEAEDVAQEVFLKAFERYDQLAGSPTAVGWLRTVTRHACLNHLLRYRGRWQFFSELTAPGEGAEAFDVASRTGNPATAYEVAERREHLGQALLRLPDALRVPLVLYHFEDASYQDISEMLGVSLAKVKTDIHRARKALKQHLTTDHGRR